MYTEEAVFADKTGTEFVPVDVSRRGAYLLTKYRRSSYALRNVYELIHFIADLVLAHLLLSNLQSAWIVH